MKPLLVLVVVVVVVSGVSLDPAIHHQQYRLKPVPIHLQGPAGLDQSQRDDYKHVLYSYSISPQEVNIRHRGQNPIRYSESTYQNPQPQPYVLPLVAPEAPSRGAHNPGFHRGSVEAHPDSLPHSLNSLASVYSFPLSDEEENLPGASFQRGAVEHVPIEATQYMAEDAVGRDQEPGPFSRSAVESYPTFPTPYTGGEFDEQMNAVVVEVPDYSDYNDGIKYGWAGIRSAVESPPLRTAMQDPNEASPLPAQLNSRPFGQWSEPLLGLGDGVESGNEVELRDSSDAIRNPHNDFSSMAGGDLLMYQSSIRQAAGDYKLICYYGGWSVYRPAPMDFSVSNIDPFACTHLIYSFAGLKEIELTMQALDPELDIVKGAYKAAVGLKAQNPALKVMIAIGGWNEGGKKYSKMASTKLNREKFIQSAIAFLQEHRFDGLDLDWEYPGASDRGGRWGDKANFADLVDELALAFRPHGYLLTAAVSPARFRVNEGYDVERISKNLDFINIMTYDLRGPWDGKADHHAPLVSRPSDAWAFKTLNTKDGIAYWALKKAPKEKLIMGIPFYGRSFTLANPSNTNPGSRAKSGGTMGQYTQERGFLAYYEICQMGLQGGWSQQKDAAGGPYMSKGDQWVGFDDKEYIAKKMQMVRQEGLGGAMVWAIDLDDYQGVCGERWPLLTTMRRSLGLKISHSYPPPSVTVVNTPPAPTTAVQTTQAPVTTTSTTTLRPAAPPTDGVSSQLDVGVPCTDGSYAPNPRDCHGYFLCVHAEWKSFSCQAPLVWNKDKFICDWPSNTNCQETAGPAPTPAAPTPGFPQPQPQPVVNPGIFPQPSPTQAPTPAPGPVDLGTVGGSGSLSGDYKVVCYFTNWAWYRPGIGKYRPEDIDPTICTHIVYGFAVLDYTNLVIKPHDSWADIDNKFYEKVVALRARGIKVTIAIGGWNDSAGDKYSRLVNNPAARAKFNQHVIQFIQKYGFDGLDLDWEYPVCWQVDCKKGPPTDKAAFASWVKELSIAFKPLGLLLSAAVSPSKKVIDAGYDVPTLNQYMDWIAVMTYDFHGHWDKKTGHVAPMYYHPESDYDYFNMDFAIRYWQQKGATKDKLVLGMPLYGQSFSIDDPMNTGLNSPARSGGQAGQFTRAKGFLAYYEICHNIQQQGWKVVRDPENRMGPYAYSGNQWVSFDDVDMLRRKSQYIRDHGLAGGMVWALDLDDFTNRCGQGRHPLMNTIKAVLGPPKSGGASQSQPPPQREPLPDPEPSFPQPQPEPLPDPEPSFPQPQPEPLPDPEPSFPLPDPEPSFPQPQPEPLPDPEPTFPIQPVVSQPQPGTPTTGGDGFKVVCYFTNWAWYRPGEGKYTPDDIDSSLCTHIVYGFAVLDTNKLLIKPHDTWADFDNKFYQRVVAHKANGVKVLIAIGGWNDSAGDKYSRLVNNPAARRAFNDHVIQFILKHNFDGLDLDWEYPVCWQVNCKKGPASDKQAFSEWIRELHEAFKPHGLLLSSAVSPSNKVIDAGYDIPALNRYLDWIAVMTYDYHGQWDKKTGHVSPMYAHSQDDNLAFNTNFTIHYWLNNGADRKKLVMGMPMYGQSFTLSQANNNGLNQPSYGGGEAGRYTRARGFLAYYEICYKIAQGGWTVVRDAEASMGPYAYKGNQWVGFDDVTTIRYKSEWIRQMGLGGGMIWALDLDDFRNRCACEPHPLLRTINRVLRGYPTPDPGCTPLGGTTGPQLGSVTTPGLVPQPVVPVPQPVVQPVQPVYPPPQPIYPPPQPIVHPTQPPPTIPPPISVIVKEEPTCTTGSRKSHPTDCNKFYECVHGKMEERQCFPGLHWNNKDRCDWPRSANCKAGGGGVPSTPPTTPSWQQPSTTTPPPWQQPSTTTQPPWQPPTTTTPPWQTSPTPPPWQTTPSTTRRTTTTTKTWWQPPKTTSQSWKPWVSSTTPIPTIGPIMPNPIPDTGYKVVCYFTNWAWYRRGLGKYKPEDIDPDLCTHIVYGFAVLDGTRLEIKPHDTWADYDNKFYQKVVAYRARGVKVTLAIGGWNDSLGDKYSRLVNSPAARRKFIKHVIAFIQKHQFDGLDLDWEYPVCWQVDCKKGPKSDKEAFALWVKELYMAFQPHGLLLSAAVSPSYKVIDLGYDVPTLNRYFDWIAVMTYDYHGHWDKKTGHVSPMFNYPESPEARFNTNFTINYWIEKGADRKKLIMGMPLYGQSFSLGWNAKGQNGLNVPADKGTAGEFTRAAGFLAYYEICDRVVNKGYTKVSDPQGLIGPYAHKGNQWVSYDDIAMIRYKSNYIKQMGLGGGMIWALDLDDFRNRCGCEPHPLLRTINRVLRSNPNPDPNCNM